jgi:hypothetical protein
MIFDKVVLFLAYRFICTSLLACIMVSREKGACPANTPSNVLPNGIIWAIASSVPVTLT